MSREIFFLEYTKISLIEFQCVPTLQRILGCSWNIPFEDLGPNHLWQRKSFLLLFSARYM